MGAVFLNIILVFSAVYSINHGMSNIYAADVFSDLAHKLKHEPSTSHVIYVDQLIKEKKFAKMQIKSSYIKKATDLYKTALDNELFSEGEFEKSDFVDLVKVVNYIKSRQRKSLFRASKYRNIYVHPSDGILRIPIQFYENNHIYVHFKNFDPNKKFGGYKTFSRSVDFESGKIFASLVTPILREKDKTSILRELNIQLALSSLSYVLSFRDVTLYEGYRKGELIHMLTFQTELYEADLSQFYGANLPDEVLASLMLQASKAVLQMHQMGYVHRDIKPANFFVRVSQGVLELVIADFGLSLDAHGPNFGKHLAGTRGYMDPQISLNHIEKRWACSTLQECELADIYSLGISFYSLIKGRHNTLKQMTSKINHVALPKDKVNPPAAKLIYRYIKELNHAYHHAPLQYSQGSDHEASLDLEKLAWSMVNPNPQKRPSLREVVNALEQINAALIQ